MQEVYTSSATKNGPIIILERPYAAYAKDNPTERACEMVSLSFSRLHHACVAVFQNWLAVLKIYSACHVNYRFSALAVNFGTQPMTRVKIVRLC